MSGPIIRQYGVPNWDDIFGKKEKKTPEEGKEGAETTPTAGAPTAAEPRKPDEQTK